MEGYDVRNSEDALCGPFSTLVLSPISLRDNLGRWVREKERENGKEGGGAERLVQAMPRGNNLGELPRGGEDSGVYVVFKTLVVVLCGV